MTVIISDMMTIVIKKMKQMATVGQSKLPFHG
jgi:hypothetical protein